MDIKQEGKKKTWKRNQICHSPGFRSEPLQWRGDFLALSGSLHQEERMVPEVCFRQHFPDKKPKPNRKGIQERKTKTPSTHGKKTNMLLTMIQYDFHWAPGEKKGGISSPCVPAICPYAALCSLSAAGGKQKFFIREVGDL